MRKSLSIFVMAAVMSLSWLAEGMARSPRPELNLSSAGLALRGYDPVSYFKAGKPVKGNSGISVSNAGAKYYFVSEENKKLFLKRPNKYLPAFGGYCAYGTAVGNKVDGDPRVWHIVKGQLYLNINRSVDRTWYRGKTNYIRKANRNWPRLRNRR